MLANVPAGHELQTEDPRTDATVPSEHNVHAVAREVPEKLPVGHAVHRAALLVLLKDPSTQSTQPPMPLAVSAEVPVGHCSQPVLSALPCCPKSQSVQMKVPAIEYEFAGHVMHSGGSDDMYLPAVQASHS